mmetsp:Transcript_2874/g.7483  ORF Transcript_2874/g.7483 Transcript_2874/m.7483 type:complete len:243 (-) Transcript_2874:137-865(-)
MRFRWLLSPPRGPGAPRAAAGRPACTPGAAPACLCLASAPTPGTKDLVCCNTTGHTSWACGRPRRASTPLVYCTRAPTGGKTPPKPAHCEGRTKMSSSPSSCLMKPNLFLPLSIVPTRGSSSCRLAPSWACAALAAPPLAALRRFGGAASCLSDASSGRVSSPSSIAAASSRNAARKKDSCRCGSRMPPPWMSHMRCQSSLQSRERRCNFFTLSTSSSMGGFPEALGPSTMFASAAESPRRF